MNNHPDNSIVLNRVLSSAWNFLDNIRDNISGNGTIANECCIYALYSEHKHLTWDKDCCIGITSLEDLSYDMQLMWMNILHNSVLPHSRHAFLQKIWQLRNDLQSYLSGRGSNGYYELLRVIIESDVNYQDRTHGIHNQPNEISEIVSYILKKNHVRSVYNPFAGLASYGCKMPTNTQYVGQEIDKRTFLFARLLLDALGRTKANMENTDSLMHWNRSSFDAVVATPPFGMRLSDRQYPTIATGLNPRNLEDRIYSSAIQENKANTIVFIHSYSVCVSPKYDALRRYLIDNNYLDTIITFPEGCFTSYAVSPVLFYCRLDRKKEEPIYMIDATQMVIPKENRMGAVQLDVTQIIDSLESSSNITKLAVNPQTIREEEYILNPIFYRSLSEHRDDQQWVRLDVLLTPAVSNANYEQLTPVSIPNSAASIDFIEILLSSSKFKVAESSELDTIGTQRRFVSEKNKKYLFVFESSYNNRYALYSGGEELCFTAAPIAKFYTINTDLVDAEYLVYELVNNKVFQGGKMPLSYCMSLPLTLPTMEEQKRVVGQLKQEYQDGVRKAQAADAARLGLKQAASDVIHMLGTPLSSQQNIVNRLRRFEGKKDDPEYTEDVQALLSVSSYINRIVRAMDADFAIADFQLDEICLDDYLQNYYEAWQHFGVNDYTLEYNNAHLNIIASIDETWLSVLLDTALDNAHRHGETIKNKGHKMVRISTQVVSYEDRPYSLLRIANNGSPLNPNFGIKNFISKGHFDGASGRSGLGGYHIYTITKRHNGYLNIHEDGEWGFVLDILLPMISTNVKQMTDYGYETI